MSMSLRIKEIRSNKKLSQVEFARALQVSQSAVSQYEKAARSPDSVFLSKLCSVFGVNLNWLLTGTGSMFQELQEVDASFLGDTISIPIVGEIAAGHPAEIIYEEPYHQLDIPVGLLSFPPPYVVFRVSGDSMAPQVMPGDLVICSEDWRNVDTNGKIMAFRTDDGITLKKLMDDIKHKTTLLIPLNSRYAPVIYVEDDPDIVMIGILDLCIRRYNREL
ncbi:MAG TPA: helix-turn-helix domain-containing protein [Candidatus Cloacimonetes bacterium]|nr:helix-turn-helix domain-containing protein [Candidatus Cloacimonadota bacterium]